jgi:uncharacterized protein YndB with AHSA1/START domain
MTSNIGARTARLTVGLVLVSTVGIGLTACSTPAEPPAAPAPAQASAAPAPSAAPVKPAELTCGGTGTDPAAKIRYGSQTTIDAPLSTVWALQTDVEGWKAWQSAIGTVERLDDGPLRAGSQFRWTTPVPATPLSPATTLDITSTLSHVEDRSCLRWSGPATGDGLSIDEGVHVWTFTETGGGVLVRTEETWAGTQVEADVALSTAALGAGLETWLAELKATAEAAETAGG